MAKVNLNAKNIAETVGLDIATEKTTGKEVLVSLQDGMVPTIEVIKDTLYPNLFQKVIMQKFSESFRGSNMMDKVFQSEKWQNGAKSVVFSGMLATKAFNFTVEIADFNPADPSTYEDLMLVRIKEMATVAVPSEQELIIAFSTPANIMTFIMSIVSKLMMTFSYKFQNERAKLIIGDKNAQIAPAHDLVVSAEGRTVKEKLQWLKHKITSFKTASSKHLSLSDQTLVYSANPENLVIIYSSQFDAAISAENAVNYKLEKLIPDLNAEVIDFTLIEGIDPVLSSKIDAILVDKDKFKHGFQLQNVSNLVKTVKLKEIHEVHNHHGFGIIANMFSMVMTNGKIKDIAIESTEKLVSAITYKNIENTTVLTRTPVVKMLNDKNELVDEA